MKRILIVKINGIGDVIMTLSMLRQIYKEEPDAEVTWITGNAGAQILRNFKLHRIITTDEKAILCGSWIGKIKAVLNVWRKTIVDRYDIAFIPYRDRRYKALVMAARCKRIKMFGRDETNRLIPVQGRRFIDEYVRFYNGTDDFSMPGDHSVTIDASKLPDVSAKKKAGKRLIILSCGGFRKISETPLALRQWPIENYRDLADALLNKGYQVIITGSSSEKWVSEVFASLSVQDEIGNLSIMELLALYRLADLTVTHDSGSLHMAGLAGGRILALFGPTNPQTFMPRGNGEYLWYPEDMACCPCYDGVKFADCKENRCLAQITASAVMNSIEIMLKRRES